MFIELTPKYNRNIKILFNTRHIRIERTPYNDGCVVQYENDVQSRPRFDVIETYTDVKEILKEKGLL